MAELISHPGRIVDVNPDFVTVEFTSRSACGSCHAAAFCGVADSETKVVQIPPRGGNWQPGQEVDICLKRGMGFKAVWLCYAIPLAVLLAVLLGLVALGLAEWVAGLAAIAATLVYYLVLRIFRDRLSNEYTFYIREK